MASTGDVVSVGGSSGAATWDGEASTFDFPQLCMLPFGLTFADLLTLLPFLICCGKISDTKPKFRQCSQDNKDEPKNLCTSTQLLQERAP